MWAVKAQLRQQLLGQISFDPQVSILDSFPMPVCRFGRAYRCRRLAGLAAFGRDEGAKQTFYGVRAHLRVCWPRRSRVVASFGRGSQRVEIRKVQGSPL